MPLQIVPLQARGRPAMAMRKMIRRGAIMDMPRGSPQDARWRRAGRVQNRWKKVAIAAEAKLGTLWPPGCSHQITG